jgi:hypothetical protein
MIVSEIETPDMKITGTSREGCTTILVLSGLVLLLGTAGHLRFELNMATYIFAGLNLAAVYGLLRRERGKP